MHMLKTQARIRPRALRTGDTVAIVAPSGAVDPERLEYGTGLLTRLGFRSVVEPNISDRRGYLAGTSDQASAAAFTRAFVDPDVSGIICAKGGYGAIRLLPYINWDAVRANPKFFCGFSDITAIHAAIRHETGLVTFHGPMAALLLDEEVLPWNEQGLLAAMTSIQPLGTVASPSGGPTVETLITGQAEGELEGGNLSLLAALCGTPWQPDLRGRLLLVEDVNEAPYRFDRMLTQLILAGAFEGVRGIVVGDSPTCDRPPSPRGLTLREVLLDRLGPLGVPMIYGFPCAHSAYRATLPLGVRAHLDADNSTLTFLEGACVPGR